MDDTEARNKTPEDKKDNIEHRILIDLKIPQAVVDHYYAEQQKKRNRNRFAIAISIITLVVVTGYTTVAFFQWRTTERALDITERAWLIGTVARLDVGRDGFMTVTTNFANAGKSPAFHVRHNTERTFDLTAPVIPLPLGAGSEVTLPQGAKVTTAWRFASIPPREVQEIVAGQKPFFVWLAIKYSDPFSGDPNVKDRSSLDCWTYDIQLKDLVICPSGQYHH